MVHTYRARQRKIRLAASVGAASLTEESTFTREITPLRTVQDNYPKTILTLDRFTVGDYEGIDVVNAVDWLLADSAFGKDDGANAEL